MTMRQRRKQFWWTWHMEGEPPYPESPRYFEPGVGRIKHQLRDRT